METHIDGPRDGSRKIKEGCEVLVDGFFFFPGSVDFSLIGVFNHSNCALHLTLTEFGLSLGCSDCLVEPLALH
jgi:hypothetical protein